MASIFLSANSDDYVPYGLRLMEQLRIHGHKGIVVIALLAACARYAFALGKAYTNEALKNSDRIHAISFGRFYLQLYGTEAKWEETKEAFQNWNIDRQSSFSGIEVNQIDPQLLDKVVDLVKSLKPSK